MSSCTWHEYVLVADVDSDGNAEIVAVANNNCNIGPQQGVYVIGDANDTWVPTRKIWNQHTYHITNINDDGTIPVGEQNNWLVPGYNNFRTQKAPEHVIHSAPDLTASLLTLDKELCPDSTRISVRIGNGGSQLVPAPADIAFYSENTLLGVVQTSVDLNPGEYEDVVLVVTPALEGEQTICVTADDNGTGLGSITECNEDNNQCCITIDPTCCEPIINPEVKTQGFWKRQCEKSHPSGEHDNLPLYVECVSETDTFATVSNVDDLCDRLNPNPKKDKCEQAEAQFMTMMLNICSGRVAPCNCISDPDLGDVTVGEAMEFVDNLLSSPDRTFKDCVLAQAIADRINNGTTLVDCQD